MLWGTYGAPEGLILAFLADVSSYGFLGRIAPHNAATLSQAREMGLEGRTLLAHEWISPNGAHSLLVHTMLWTKGRPRLLKHLDGRLLEND